MSKKSDLKRKYQALKDAIKDFYLEKMDICFNEEPIDQLDNAYYKFMGAILEVPYHQIKAIMEDIDND